MVDKIEITKEQFKDYVNLKIQNDLYKSYFDKLYFMSGLNANQLCQLNLKQYNFDASDVNYDKYIFIFEKYKSNKKDN